MSQQIEIDFVPKRKTHTKEIDSANYSLYSLGWSWWMEWCERKILLAGWWLEAGAGVV